MSKRNIQYVKQDEPSFIAQFKRNVGYKEGPTVDTKRAELERDESGSDEEDEKPTVVVLKKGDLTQEEYDRYKQDSKGSDSTEATHDVANKTEDDIEPPADGRILFKKPVKRSSDTSDLIVSTKKKKDSSSKNSDKKDKDKTKGVKNKQLLSFDDEEEEED